MILKIYNSLNFLQKPYAPYLIAFIGVFFCLPSLWGGFAVDDYIMQIYLSGSEKYPDIFPQTNNIFMFANGDSVRNLKLMDIGLLPWWTSADVHLSFWRPVSVYTHLLDQYLWPNSTIMMHAQNLFWYAILILAVGKLYRNVIGIGVVSGIALLLYALDEKHGLPVGWISSRNSIISTFFGVLAIHFHIVWRDKDQLFACFLASVFFCLALLSGESGIAAFAYLFAYFLTLEKSKIKNSFFTLAPYISIIIIWRFIYNHLGFGQSGSSLYIDPLAMPFEFITGLFAKAPIYLLSQWTHFSCSTFFLQDSNWQAIWIFFALVVLLIVLALLKPLLIKNKMSQFWFFGMLFSLVPISATFNMDRLLFFVGIGGLALLALLFEYYFNQRDEERTSKFMKSIVISLFIIHLVLSPLLLPARSFTTGFFHYGSEKLSESLKSITTVKGKTLIIVNAPMNVSSLIFFINSYNNDDLPEHIVNLAPNELRSRIELTRINENSIMFKTRRGFARKSLFSRPKDWEIGQVIELESMKIKIVELTEDGRPLTVVYEFKNTLESNDYIWLSFSDMKYNLYSFLPVGETDYFKQNL